MKKFYYFFLSILAIHCIPLHAATPQEEVIAKICRAKRLLPKPAPTASPIAQAVDAEEQAEEEEIAPEESIFEENQE